MTPGLTSMIRTSRKQALCLLIFLLILWLAFWLPVAAFAAPAAVDTLSLDPQGNGTTVTLDWTGYDEPAQGDVAGYRIYAQNAQFTTVDTLTPYAEISAGTFSAAVDSLERDTQYWFAVVAYDSQGQGITDVTSLPATPEDIIPPGNPTNLTVTGKQTGLDFYWTHPADTDNDLNGYIAYFDNDPEGVPVPIEDYPVYTVGGLSPATVYDFKIASIDTSGNISSGTEIQGATFLPNPDDVTAQPSSGSVTLSWSPVEPADLVLSYKVYMSQSDFSNVYERPPIATVQTPSAEISGLTDDTTYFFAVTTVNISNGENRTVNTIQATPGNHDTQGPELTAAAFDDAPLMNGQTLTCSGTVTAEAEDPAGVSKIAFYLDGSLLSSDFSPPYTAYLDIDIVQDGSHVLTIKPKDSLSNESEYLYDLNINLGPPNPPAITEPENHTVVNRLDAVFKGTADRHAIVTLYHDSVETGASGEVDASGHFTIPLTLHEGENRIRAAAANRSGSGPLSTQVVVNVDTRIPDAPSGLRAEAKEAGAVKLLWQKPYNKTVNGYHIYRSRSPFTDTAQAQRINQNLVSTPSFTDLPPDEAAWYYRVLAEDSAGTQSPLSGQAQAVSDETAPQITDLEFSPQGNFINDENMIFSTGRVDFTFNITEPIDGRPFVILTPNGHTPIGVEVNQDSETGYSGFFTIEPDAPSGAAYLTFSARDLAGNRGGRAQRVNLDTHGPTIVKLKVVPGSPVKNDSGNPVTLTITFALDEKMDTGTLPEITGVIQGLPGQIPCSDMMISENFGEDAQAWECRMVLPAAAGETEAQTLDLQYTGQDVLANISHEIDCRSSFQIYQQGLPPLESPEGLTAETLAGGRIRLFWEAVETAAGYQIFRTTPPETEPAFLTALIIGPEDPHITEYTDQTPADGSYTYAVYTIRRENGEESVSGLCTPVSVISDATAPAPPAGLTLELLSQGIKIQWDASPSGETVTYRIYRSDQAQITSVENLDPLIRDVGQTCTTDTAPSPEHHCYAVTAVDEAGNESGPCESGYLSFDLLPVSAIQVTQSDNDPPQVSWTHPDDGSHVAGYFIYLGKDETGFKVNDILMTQNSFTDTGYSGDDRSYCIIAEDNSQNQSLARFVTLPAVTVELPSGLKLKRGMMNPVDYRVSNTGNETVEHIRIIAAVRGHDHLSAPFSLAPGESKTIPVVIGGYGYLQDLDTLRTVVDITPHPGENARIIRNRDIEISDALMVLQLKTESFIKGGTGQVSFTLENTGPVPVEIITAEKDNTKASSQIRYTVMDEDDNVYYEAFFKQTSGGQLAMLPNGKTVAVIPAGKTFSSEPMDLFIPSNAPDEVIIRLGIDHIYYHLGEEDAIELEGTANRRTVRLEDTSYTGEIISALPAVSQGGEDIVITGRAVERDSNDPLPGVPLRLILTVNGFERGVDVITDDEGLFSTTFTPLPDEAGVYKAAAIHPHLSDRPEQAGFIINRVDITPARLNLTIPRNYEQKISFKVTPKNGTDLSNLRFDPAMDIPQGVHIGFSDVIAAVSGGETVNPELTLWADNTADEFGQMEFRLISDDSAAPWGSVILNTQFTEARPALFFTPDYIETGVTRSRPVTETITLENRGQASMNNIRLHIEDRDGNPAPGWIRLNTPDRIGTLAPGGTCKAGISFVPDEDTADGLHSFNLMVSSDNCPAASIGLYPTVTREETGHVLFKISDIYTGTFNYKNELIRGLDGVRIEIRNEEDTGIAQVKTTDAMGEALFENLPSGPYTCRITRDGHVTYTGCFSIKPGIIVNKPVFLESNLVGVEWDVNENTVQDTQDIVLDVSYESNVPAAVVVAEPAAVTLPAMETGDVFHGEFTLKNHGLVRADHLAYTLPRDDAFFQYEALAGLPDSLEPGAQITLPYRITCLHAPSLIDDEESGGGSYIYWQCASIDFDYTSADGELLGGSTQHCIHADTGGRDAGSGSHPPYTISSDGGHNGTTGSSNTSPGPDADLIVSRNGRCLPKVTRSESLRTGPNKPGEPRANMLTRDSRVRVDKGMNVNILLREYNEKELDIAFKAVSGTIAAVREYWGNQWYWSLFSSVKDGQPDDSPDALFGDDPRYITKDEIPYRRISKGIYKSGTYTIERKPGDGFLADKYLYREKLGQWKQYDSLGRLTAYGNRNNTVAQLSYDSPEDTRPCMVSDDLGQPVFWLDYYPGGRLYKIMDTGGRTVLYEYDDNKNLYRVTDVTGRTVTYEYDENNRLILKSREKDSPPVQTSGVKAADNPAPGTATHITYNNEGDIIKVTDKKGVGYTFEYQYDENQKLYYTTITASSGRIREVWSNEDGETVRVDINGVTVSGFETAASDVTHTDHQGNATTYEFDANENLMFRRFPDPDICPERYDIDPRLNKPVFITDALGRVTGYNYDAKGNLVEKIDAFGTALARKTTITRDNRGKVLTVTIEGDADTEPVTTTYTYDPITGYLTTVTDPMGNVTRLTDHDDLGNPKKVTDPRGHEWEYDYDEQGRIISVRDPLTAPDDVTAAYEYDENGNRKTMTDAYKNVFVFEYDDHHNMVRAIDPLGEYVEIDYNTDSLPEAIADQSKKIVKREYDTSKRLTKTIDGAGNVVEYVYPKGKYDTRAPYDKPYLIKYPTFDRHLEYNRMGWLVKEQDWLYGGEVIYTRSYEYDGVGNLVASTDEENRTTRFEYDGLNRPFKTVLPNSDEIIRHYDIRNNLIRLEDPKKGMHYFTYDRNNRMKTTARPMGEITRFEYDPNGNRTAVNYPNGNRIEYDYNEVNRITEVRTYEDFIPDQLNLPEKTTAFAYDLLGNLISYNDGITSGAYTYDALSRKLTETVTYKENSQGSFFRAGLEYSYYPNGLKKTFDMWAECSDGPPPAGSRPRLLPPKQAAYARQTIGSVSYEYDENNRLAGIETNGNSISYIYDKDHWNRPARMRLPNNIRQSFGYDKYMRTASITVTNADQNTPFYNNYNYSPAGNLASKETDQGYGGFYYQYDDLDRLENVNAPPGATDESYTYDANGNRLTAHDVTNEMVYNENNQLEEKDQVRFDYDPNGNLTYMYQPELFSKAFEYDPENRMVRYTGNNGSTKYYYDPFGRRLWKEKTGEANGERTYFFYSDEGLAAEFDNNGNLTKTYGYTPDSTWTTNPVFTTENGQFYWYLNDRAATPQKIVNNAGNVVWSAIYDSFGNAQIQTEDIKNNLRFAGQYYDEESGLHYNLNRYYDPELGRYLREDPLGLAGGINLYAYCFNNPNKLIDPLGLYYADIDDPDHTTPDPDGLDDGTYGINSRIINSPESLTDPIAMGRWGRYADPLYNEQPDDDEDVYDLGVIVVTGKVLGSTSHDQVYEYDPVHELVSGTWKGFKMASVVVVYSLGRVTVKYGIGIIIRAVFPAKEAINIVGVVKSYGFSRGPAAFAGVIGFETFESTAVNLGGLLSAIANE